MKYSILHEIPGRLRLKLDGPVPKNDIEPLKHVLSSCPFVLETTVYARIGSVAVRYRAVEGAREAVLEAAAGVDADAIDAARIHCAAGLSLRADGLFFDIARLICNHFLRRWFMPRPLRTLYSIRKFGFFAREAWESLKCGRLDVPVLDAAAIGISFIKRDSNTAMSTMFLLNLGETLEDYTRARSENELIGSLLSMNETVRLVRGDQEMSVAATDLQENDLVVIRTGMQVCVDGTVERGCAMVNQAALTGEPLAVERTVGDDVFAGTAVEDGEIFVRVHAVTQNTRLRSIVNLVESSESMKAQTQFKREHLADSVVPWNFALAGGVALATRNLEKTSAALMVDYSCALKLTGSIAVLSAMSQSAKQGFTVKGSKHFESFAEADTIVFDKTGTLTDATPRVSCVIALDDWNRTQVLRFAACLEEHFPHPVARAVVRAAEEKNLKHRERHAEVEYIVAHGIASSLNGKRAVIGSEHFVIEDEHVVISEEQRELIERETNGCSVLYLAVDGRLVGAIGIYDPLKPGVPEAVDALRRLGFKHVVMLTGDNERTAGLIARQANITEYAANLLPEEKHAYIETLKAQGKRVVMVGDGVNDSPALSAAHVGVAMGAGTAIAKEVADITLNESDLQALVRLRKLSTGLMARMDASFKQVVGINSALLAAGIAGIISPQLSSLLHNASTVALALRGSRDYRL